MEEAKQSRSRGRHEVVAFWFLDVFSAKKIRMAAEVCTEKADSESEI